ncbi:MAG: OmpA family protein [Planctomycetes bacterium]|nr:OmpA family protein [Planctomycetota bacterium]
MGFERKKEEKEEELSAPYWMLTYGDLMGQLLCFFVILFTLSTIDPAKFEEVLGAIKSEFGTGESSRSDEPISAKEIIQALTKQSSEPGPSSGVMYEDISGFYVRVTTLRTGVVLAVGGRPLFDPGSAEIRDDAKPILREVAQLTAGYRNRIRVVGHTEPSETPVDPEIKAKPREDQMYWLSFARGNNVRKFLTDPEALGEGKDNEGFAKYRIHPSRIEVDAASSHQPWVSNLGEGTKELKDTDTVGKKFNRRVEVVVTEELVPWSSITGGG